MYMNTAEVPNKSNAVGLGIDKWTYFNCWVNSSLFSLHWLFCCFILRSWCTPRFCGFMLFSSFWFIIDFDILRMNLFKSKKWDICIILFLFPPSFFLSKYMCNVIVLLNFIHLWFVNDESEINNLLCIVVVMNMYDTCTNNRINIVS